MSEPLTLSASDWQISVLPQCGAAITLCTYRRRPIFRTAAIDRPTDPLHMSHFPLVPYSNRIAPGRFHFGGQDYDLAPNYPEQIFALHGEGWLLPWRVLETKENSLTLGLDYTPLPGHWPFAFRARHEISVAGPVLTLSLSLKNTDSTPCPAGLGLHPYFPQAQAATIAFNAVHMWEANEQTLPVARKICAGLIDYSGGRPVSERALDNVFSGWPGEATIRWQGRPDTLTLRSDTASNLVVYTPAGENFFCAEPVTQINNALHIAAEDTPDGMTRLAPGEQVSLSATFSVT